MKRLLLTGAAGFFGHHVLEYVLNNTDWQVVCLVRLNTVGDLNRIAEIAEIKKHGDRARFVYHDLKFSLNNDVAQKIGKVDYVLHLAANTHVDRSIINPKEFFEDNVIGTVNLLEWLRHYNPEARLVNFGTDEVFGPAPDDYKFKEDDRYRPSNPYSASKAGQICAGMSYHMTYGLDIISAYTMNIFGERQCPEKFVPACIKNFIAGKQQAIHAKLRKGLDETQNKKDVLEVGQRHWLYAGNAADALLFILKKGKAGEHYNIVGDTELQNDELALMIAGILKKEHKLKKNPELIYVDFHKTRPGHDRRYALDGSKIAAMGWKPKLSFEDSLKKTVDWTVKNKQVGC